MNASVLGIEIGGTKLQIVVGDETGTIEERFRFEVDRRGGAAGIRQQIEPAMRRITASRRLTAIGVGFGGPVDWRTGRICCSHHVAGWSDFPFGAWLQSLATVPAHVDNDANVAALGEALRGAGSGHNPVFYVTLGSGVGGGLAVDGRIFHGAMPGEAELGHVRLDRSGRTVESCCAGWAVDRKIRELAERAPDCLLARLAGGGVGREAKHLGAALTRGDPLAHQILRETAEDLAFGLSHVTHLFHPEIIVVGGGLALLGEPLRREIAAALPQFVMDAFQPGPQVVLAMLGEDAVPEGALLLASQSGIERHEPQSS